jgi:transcriptional regulator with XRE-family HTH domain
MSEHTSKLEAARRLRGWTLEIASQKIGVHPQTLRNWERGKSKPHGFRIRRISQVYETTPAALELEWGYDDQPASFNNSDGFIRPEHFFSDITEPTVPIDNLDLRLLSLIIQRKLDHWSHDYHSFQLQIDQCIREYDEYMQAKPAPNAGNTERQQALHAIATIPILIYLEHMDRYQPTLPEDILVHCAAGITACWHMGQDFVPARTFISGYLILLSDIFTRSEYYREETAELIAQACLLRMLLASQLEGPQTSINYYIRALEFGRIAEKIASPQASLAHLSSLHRYGKQPEQILKRIAEAIWLLKPAPSLPDFPLIREYVQKLASLYQFLAPDGQDFEPSFRPGWGEQARSTELDYFPSTIDYASTALNLWDGITHDKLDEYARTLDDLRPSGGREPVCDAPEIVRMEFLSNRALAALRLHDMDQAITTMRASIPAVLTLGDERDLVEVHEAYHLMQFLLPGQASPPTSALKDMLKTHD